VEENTKLNGNEKGNYSYPTHTAGSIPIMSSKWNDIRDID
jgi:hypothetical protein